MTTPSPGPDAQLVGEFIANATDRHAKTGIVGRTLYVAVAYELLMWLQDPLPTPEGQSPVTAGVKVVDRNPGHVRLSVYSGRNPYARGHSGTLTVRTDEWPEFRARLELAGFDITDDTLEGSIQP